MTLAMKGLIGLSIIWCQCFLLSNAITENKIPREGNLRTSITSVDDALSKLIVYVTKLRRDFGIERKLKPRFQHLKGKCGKHLVATIGALQTHIDDVQYTELVEGRRSHEKMIRDATNRIPSQAPAARSTVSPKNFMRLEFDLRDLVSKTLELAKLYNLENIPKYTVGLGPRVTAAALDKELHASEKSMQSFRYLIAIEECLQSFKRNLDGKLNRGVRN